MLLKRGMKNDDVKKIQTRLKELGFFDAEATGFFGELTELAVKKFQKMKNLEVDGVVGSKTWESLFPLKKSLNEDNDTLEISPERIHEIMPESPLENIRKYWPKIEKALKKYGLWYREMVLMTLGTIYAETVEFKPISEYVSKYNTPPGGKPYSLYDFRKDIGNNAIGDGDRYKGRGFIQLTGKYNYDNYGKRLGVDLIENPELANDPEIAAEILVLFLKDKEAKILKALKEGDLRLARKYVNGGSHGLNSFITVFDLAEENDFGAELKRA